MCVSQADCLHVNVCVFCSKLIKISKYNKAAGGQGAWLADRLSTQHVAYFLTFSTCVQRLFANMPRHSCLCGSLFVCCFLALTFALIFDSCLHTQAQEGRNTHTHTRTGTGKNNNKNLLPKLRQIASASFLPVRPLSLSVSAQLLLDVHTFCPYL